MDQSPLLQEIGLTQKESVIYQLLLGYDAVPARTIVLDSAMPRGTVYEILGQLIDKGLVVEVKLGSKAHFRAKHPYALKNYVHSQLQTVKHLEQKLESVLPDFVTLYQSAQQRPGVQFFEGKEGVKKVLWDSLTSTTEILTVADVEAIEAYIPDIDREYVKQRNKLHIQKRLLVLDNEVARRMIADPEHFTADTKLCTLDISPFSTGIQIYDNKIAYITMTEQYLTATLIQDQHIYSMQKALFDFIWNTI